MAFNLSTPNRTIHAGVIPTKGEIEMIDVAPFEFFSWTNKDSLTMLGFPPLMIEEALDIKLHWVSEDGDMASLKSNAKIMPTDSFASCPPLDIVLMGSHGRYHLSEGEGAFIRKAFDECSAFLSVCAGVFAMLEAGVLEGKTVSAPRMALDGLRKNAPNVNWVDKRWVRDGKIWSSNTLINGFDLMRGFSEEIWGGRSGMIETLLDSSHYPVRDVDFKDYHGENYPLASF